MFFAAIPVPGRSDRAGSHRDLFIGYGDERGQARSGRPSETCAMAKSNPGKIPEPPGATSPV